MICVGRPTSAPAIVKPQQNGSYRAYSFAHGCRNDTRHIQCSGAKSFVDDLDLSRGVVLSRAVPCCDLLRLSLLTRRFVRSGRTSLRDSGGRFDLSYIFTCIYMARPVVVSPSSSSSLLPATLTARRQLARRLPAWSACLVYLPASKRQHSRVVIVSVCLEFHKEGCFVLPPPARSAGQGVPAGRQAGAGGKMQLFLKKSRDRSRPKCCRLQHLALVRSHRGRAWLVLIVPLRRWVPDPPNMVFGTCWVLHHSTVGGWRGLCRFGGLCDTLTTVRVLCISMGPSVANSLPTPTRGRGEAGKRRE